MLYMITFDDGRLFVAPENNLFEIKADLLKYCSEDDMNIDGPYDFVEINNRLSYDPQTV